MDFSLVKASIYKPIGKCLTLFRSLKRSVYKDSKPRLFLLNIPTHGNLGDHLISVAEQEFLSKYFPDRQIVLVSSADLYFSIRFALLDVKEKDILCVTGGGFMGSLYDEEGRFLKIIKRYPNNRLVFFPQTIYYAPTEEGNKMIGYASSIYSSNKNLYVAARDTTTYKLLSEILMPNHPNHVFLTPDIALYKRYPSKENRNGVLWCIRRDSESLWENDTFIRVIHKILSGKPIKQSDTDTYINRSIPREKEYEEVESKLKEFSSARLVITDRLHGMIYSAITNTPVIALDNVSHKVSQVYYLWLKDIPFVKFVDGDSCIEQMINELLSINNPSYDNKSIIELYKPIIDAIKA